MVSCVPTDECHKRDVQTGKERPITIRESSRQGVILLIAILNKQTDFFSSRLRSIMMFAEVTHMKMFTIQPQHPQLERRDLVTVAKGMCSMLLWFGYLFSKF